MKTGQITNVDGVEFERLENGAVRMRFGIRPPNSKAVEKVFVEHTFSQMNWCKILAAVRKDADKPSSAADAQRFHG